MLTETTLEKHLPTCCGRRVQNLIDHTRQLALMQQALRYKGAWLGQNCIKISAEVHHLISVECTFEIPSPACCSLIYIVYPNVQYCMHGQGGRAANQCCSSLVQCRNDCKITSSLLHSSIIMASSDLGCPQSIVIEVSNVTVQLSVLLILISLLHLYIARLIVIRTIILWKLVQLFRHNVAADFHTYLTMAQTGCLNRGE